MSPRSLPVGWDAFSMSVTDQGHRGAPGPLPPSSLILCSRNRPQMLLETIESVVRGDDVPTEIIVIDQSDRPHPMLSGGGGGQTAVVRYYRSTAIGVSRARNTAITIATHDVLVFLDDDIVVTPTWYRSLMCTLESAGSGAIVTGQVRAAPAELPGGFAPSTTMSDVPAVYRGRVGRDVLFSGNMAGHRASFVAVGGFDERLGPGSAFPAAEDNDLGFRLLEAGNTIHYVPEAVVYHRAWRAQSTYLRLLWGYGKGQGAFYAKHVRRYKRHMVRRAMRDTGGYLIESVSQLFQRRPQHALGAIVAVLGSIAGGVAWFDAERRT